MWVKCGKVRYSPEAKNFCVWVFKKTKEEEEEEEEVVEESVEGCKR
jgi:hypothetical protein